MSDSYLLFRLPESGSTLAAPEPRPHFFSCSRMPESDGSIRLVLTGELDLAARAHFASALVGAQVDSDRVLLDLDALTLIDCASLFVVFTAARRSHREEAVLILLNPRGQVRRVLDLVGAPAGVDVLDHGDLQADARIAAASLS
jgi:anti-anti-sigma factor